MARSREIICPNCGAVIPDSAGREWFTVRANMHEEKRIIWDTAVNHISTLMRQHGRGPHPSPRMAAGQVLEILCAEYLAGLPTEEVSGNA